MVVVAWLDVEFDYKEWGNEEQDMSFTVFSYSSKISWELHYMKKQLNFTT